MADYHTIPIGLDWNGVEFQFESGFFEPGDRVRCELRRWPNDDTPLVVLEHDAGTLVDGDSLFLWMTDVQTTAIGTEGSVSTSPLLIRSGQSVFLDVVFTFEALYPWTLRGVS